MSSTQTSEMCKSEERERERETMRNNILQMAPSKSKVNVVGQSASKFMDLAHLHCRKIESLKVMYYLSFSFRL